MCLSKCCLLWLFGQYERKKEIKHTFTGRDMYLSKWIVKKRIYLGNYWYDLKYLTRGLHGVYTLFYKMISVLGTPGMASRYKYHYLVDGPQTIDTNLKIYDYLLKIIDIQIGIISTLVRMSSVCNVQDTISLKLHRVIKIFDAILYNKEKNVNPWHYNLTSCRLLPK